MSISGFQTNIPGLTLNFSHVRFCPEAHLQPLLVQLSFSYIL